MENTNIETRYDYYIEQTRKIIAEENRQRMIRQAKQQKAERIYYIKQKLSGLAMVAIGIAIPFIADGDASFSLIAVPVGIYLILTKEKVMMF